MHALELSLKMNVIKYYLIEITCLLLRFFPFPTHTGLVKVGNPTEHSPVLITGNYILTVARLLRALKGVDCYVIVANSHGVNVWCAATGGHFTTHEVISALKTSGIEDLVKHRTVILPQLAATGIDGRIITKKTKWHVKWGPVEAKDLPAFLNAAFEKTKDYSRVTFPLPRRLEMAITLAFPISIIMGVIFLILWPADVMVAFSLPWVASLILLVSFPLYEPLLRHTKDWKVKSVSLPFEWLVLLPLTTVFLVGFVHVVLLSVLKVASIDTPKWVVTSLITSGTVTMDLMGITPTYKSSMSKERFFHITVDEEKCKGARFCEDVCPKDCFDFDEQVRVIRIPRGDECVQCGACVVQCPFDALYFENPDTKERIPPEIIRTYKLNLMGARAVKAE